MTGLGLGRTPNHDRLGIVHAKLDTEAQPRIPAAVGITAIPTLMAFREGHLVFNQAGALPAPALAHIVDAVKDLDMNEVREDTAAQNNVRSDETATEH
jgi:thioredoxin